MKELREMTEEEIRELDGKQVVSVYSDFEEKVNGKKTVYPETPFSLIITCGKYYTDGEMIIHYGDHTINTWLDFICKGYDEEEARKKATNDKVTTTSIFKLV